MHNTLDSLDSNTSLITKNLNIFLYPNQYYGAVFIQNVDTSEILRTGFYLPPWITQNALKILERTSNQGANSSQTLEAETLKRKQEEKMNKLSDEIKSIKKGIESMKYDVKSVLTILKRDIDKDFT